MSVCLVYERVNLIEIWLRPRKKTVRIESAEWF